MMFFSVLNSPAPYSNVEVDLALRVLREEFLCLAITNAIYAIPEELSDGQEGNDLVSVSRLTDISVRIKEYKMPTLICIT